MRPLEAQSLRQANQRLLILDQQTLPAEETWRDGTHPNDMVQHIVALKVRGAPLIGVAAALSLALHAEKGASQAELAEAAERLRSARPTAVNLAWAVDRIMGEVARGGNPVREAEAIFDEDVALCEAMANHGSRLIADGNGIITHCNSGGLATVGVGTALGAIRRAWEQGKGIHVFVNETRPLLQGARLTAWELTKLGIPFTLLTDSMAPILMEQGRVQRALVGADRIAKNGDFANKVGTFSLAICAQYHHVPFHAVAPYSTVDLGSNDGSQILIEQRAAAEVRGVAGSFGSVAWAPPLANVFNPAFDVTPVTLVESIVLDGGIFSRSDLARGALSDAVVAARVPVRRAAAAET